MALRAWQLSTSKARGRVEIEEQGHLTTWPASGSCPGGREGRSWLEPSRLKENVVRAEGKQDEVVRTVTKGVATYTLLPDQWEGEPLVASPSPCCMALYGKSQSDCWLLSISYTQKRQSHPRSVRSASSPRTMAMLDT